MSDVDHRDEARLLLRHVTGHDRDKTLRHNSGAAIISGGDSGDVDLAAAQVHATLALVDAVRDLVGGKDLAAAWEKGYDAGVRDAEIEDDDAVGSTPNPYLPLPGRAT